MNDKVVCPKCDESWGRMTHKREDSDRIICKNCGGVWKYAGEISEDEYNRIINIPTKTRIELAMERGSRMCVCGSAWNWNGMPENETDFHCNNKRCVWWNIVTNLHSTPVSQLDLLYRLTYDRGFCKCKKPKYHSTPHYFLCVNDDCFKVLNAYKDIVIKQSLYPRSKKWID